jgi:hypothetical protein
MSILTKSLQSRASAYSGPSRRWAAPIQCDESSSERLSGNQFTCKQSLAGVAIAFRSGISLAITIPSVGRRERFKSIARLLANAVRSCRDPLSAGARRGSFIEVILCPPSRRIAPGKTQPRIWGMASLRRYPMFVIRRLALTQDGLQLLIRPTLWPKPSVHIVPGQPDDQRSGI